MDNHVEGSRLTHAHRIVNEHDCAECGGTGSILWEMSALVDELGYKLYQSKKRKEHTDIISTMRLLLSLYNSGRECPSCEGTGKC